MNIATPMVSQDIFSISDIIKAVSKLSAHDPNANSSSSSHDSDYSSYDRDS
jgi:hypothetical protein